MSVNDITIETGIIISIAKLMMTNQHTKTIINIES